MQKIMWYVVGRRRPLVVAIHAVLAVLANYCAFLLRFDGHIDPFDLHLFYRALPWLIGIRLIIFAFFRLHEGLWRYVSVWDLSKIVQGCFVSTVIFAIAIRDVGHIGHYPISIYVLDPVLLVALMGGSRLARRLYREIGNLEKGRRVLIVGAGDAGEMIVRDMKHNPYYGYEPIGFVDDDARKVGTRVHGVQVLGTRQDLAWIMERTVPQEVLIAMPSARAAEIRSVFDALETFKVQIRTLPNLRDLLQGKVSVSQIRDLALEDLLDRRMVQLDATPVRRLLQQNRRVLVTGAAGSVGSELCRQVLALDAGVVFACDRHENGLFELQQELSPRFGDRFVPIVADVTDAHRMHAMMVRWRPDIVFHAAAYKHVPMMQANPCEATKNNVTGTRIIAEAAHAADVGRFILISTDKAVNPTSVMGATKRVAEMLVRGMAEEGRCFVTVRFGNVLGSNGSVVPQFLRQIREGGPITVTHGEMRRFFMLIPEAVQLVLHAATAGQPGQIYVLEMGQQIRILDMARNLARLAGYVPEVEMPIKIVGLRPGEKLYEELIAEDEVAVPSPIPNVVRVESRAQPKSSDLMAEISDLEQLAWQGDDQAVLECLCRSVPTCQFDFTDAVHVPRAPVVPALSNANEAASGSLNSPRTIAWTSPPSEGTPALAMPVSISPGSAK